ncbi:MAG: 2-hydroxyacid dehydrogenase, partial [Betaproteobacteria bacterium]|nr:2-hydroxyacid dehydrogenase [Betaproteobacteria bacterium]
MIDILRVSNLPHDMLSVLQTTYLVHDRDHITDPGALGRIRAMVSAGSTVIDRKLMMLFPAVEAICICGESLQSIDLAATADRNIKVLHTPHVQNPDVAEFAIGMLLAATRRLAHADRFVRISDWVDGPYPLTRRMSGGRLGLVGMGDLSQAIAKRARAFDMQVHYTALQEVPLSGAVFHPSVKDLAAQVDFLMLAESGPDAPAKAVNAEVLQLLGLNGYLINLANADAVDQAALLEAVQKKALGGAALDVFPEAPRVAAELRNAPTVVL